jgi:hypothetical protein
MGETLTQQRRVSDEGLRVVKLCRKGKMACGLIGLCFDGTSEEAPANFVPAAAVIRRVQALFGIIGRKARVGGM